MRGSSSVKHDHRPTANALAMAGKAFKKAGMNAHFDVGLDNAGDNRYPEPLSPFSTSCASPMLKNPVTAMKGRPTAAGLRFCTAQPNAVHAAGEGLLRVPETGGQHRRRSRRPHRAGQGCA